MACGIYEIVNAVNGKRYIGSTSKKTRWQEHRRLLRRSKHHSPMLQSAWNRYGEGAFTFRLLEECSLSDLIIREQHYLDTLKPEYNVSKTAGSPRGVKKSQEALAKLKLSMARFKASPAYVASNALRAESLRLHWREPGSRDEYKKRLRERFDAQEGRGQLQAARAAHRPDWTDEMITVLMNRYPTEGSGIASDLGVTPSAVRHKAMRLGLSFGRPTTPS
jgi:group I intron endonuclease